MIIDDKTFLFVDGISLNGLTKPKDYKVHFDLIISELNTQCQIARATYYFASHYNTPSFCNFIKCLQCFSYRTYVQQVESEDCDVSIMKGLVNISMSADMGLAANQASQIILITGDAALTHAANRLRSANVRVCILGCNSKYESLFKRASDFYADADIFLRKCFEVPDDPHKYIPSDSCQN